MKPEYLVLIVFYGGLGIVTVGIMIGMTIKGLYSLIPKKKKKRHLRIIK